MAWFGEGLSSLSNLKGQITSFTKDVLSEGIIEEIGNEANERCVQLQELLTAKDAEISLLRRQNCELQKTVIEINTKPKDVVDVKQQDEECEGFFWDPLSVKNRNPKNCARQLQEQLSQATLRIRELEAELKRLQKVHSTSMKDEINDGHQRAEFHRAKQDMMNRIIQIEEKTRESERNAKRVQLDELTIINDFRTVISKLESSEKLNLVREVLKALEIENEKDNSLKEEKSNFDEKLRRVSENCSDPASLKPLETNNADTVSQSDQVIDLPQHRETELYKKIEELNQENKNLFANIEELDRQHAESIEELLSLKRDLEKKHQCLQNGYEKLYVDYNEAEAKAIDLENKLKSVTSNKVIPTTASQFVQTEIVQNLDNGVQTELPIEDEPQSSLDNSHLVKLEHKIKDILKNTCIDAEQGESIFESVAKKYVDTKWKQDVLERKLTETTRDMKDIIKLKDGLQMECDDMQSHIDSLLIEIQRLKQNLPSIPEACEERVASLETETETLHEDIKRLEAENDELWKKNAELTNAIRDFEMAFRDQDSLEPEIRSMKEQVDFPSNPVEMSKSEETEESSDENIDNRKSNLPFVNKNFELEKSSDYTESSEKQLREELRIISEKYEALEKQSESYKDTKEELEQSKKTIHDLLSTIKALEENAGTLESSTKEPERGNDTLSQKNQELVMELDKLRDTASRSEDTVLIKELQMKLDICNREIEDREYDILLMSNELSTAMNEMEEKHGQIQLLSKTNEDLTKENSVLTDQLSAVKNESLEEITKLRTEKSILEEEQTEAKQEIFNNHEELVKLKEKMHEMEEDYQRLTEELLALKSGPHELLTENERLSNEIKQVNEQLAHNKTIEQKLMTMQHMYEEVTNEYKKLQDEFSVVCLKLQELQKENDGLQNIEMQFKNATEELNLIQCKNKEMEVALEGLEKYKFDIKTMEEQLHLERSSVKTLQIENSKLKTIFNEHMSCSSEMERLTSAIIEKTKENDALKSENEKLKADIAHKSNVHNPEMTIIETIDKLTDRVRHDTNADHSENLSASQNELDELLKYVQIKHSESVQYHAEIQRLSQLLQEQSLRMQSLITERTVNQAALKEKNNELLSTQNELQIVRQRLQELKGSNDGSQICNITAHTDQLRDITILNEKCNAMEAALVQEQLSNRILQNQLSESQNKEAISVKELERLRAHLVEMESTYTEEAVIAEETRKELEAKLLQAEEKMKNSSTVYTSASIRANQQVETLQQQIALIVQQRDDIQHKLSLAEDKILAQTASLTNLQLVLEQFQRDKENDIIITTEKLQNKLHESYKTQEKLANEVSELKDQLADAKQCLQAASRLSEQLDKKTEKIEFLNQEVRRLTELVDSSDQRIQILKQTEDSKVDKTLVKNLVLGYLSSAATDKSSVLRVIATVLDFNEQEREKTGVDASGNTGWFARLSGGNTTMATKDQETSLTAAFVRFLESESKPKPQLPGLPISNSPLSKPSHSRQHSTSSTNQSTLLLSNVSLPTFPDFVPARNTGSILKEVLKDS